MSANTKNPMKLDEWIIDSFFGPLGMSTMQLLNCRKMANIFSCACYCRYIFQINGTFWEEKKVANYLSSTSLFLLGVDDPATRATKSQK